MSAPRFVSVRVTIIGIDLIKSNSILWGKKIVRTVKQIIA